jgi:hypothetical protein
MAVRLDDLVNAVEFVSMDGGSGENLAMLCRKTGEIHYRSELSGIDELAELPSDVEDSPDYVAIPDKRDLNLGEPMVLDFARKCLPDDFDEVRSIFSHRGAYGQFKLLLNRKNALQSWYDFEAKATERAIRQWCDGESITLAD